MHKWRGKNKSDIQKVKKFRKKKIMIGWEDMYKVVSAMAPLYVALALGYASVRWWHMFKPDHCDAINRFNCYFIMPFFGFEFTAHFNPYTMNYKFMLSDVIAKCIIGAALVLWANFSGKGNLSCSITIFSLSSLNNSLVVGVPLLKAMYGELGVDIVIQSSVIQALLWIIALIFMLELNRVKSMNDGINNGDSSPSPSPSIELVENVNGGRDLEQNERRAEVQAATEVGMVVVMVKRPSFWSIMKIVLLKLVKNPNAYATPLGIIWALFSNK